jgi:hypothetical protein
MVFTHTKKMQPQPVCQFALGNYVAEDNVLRECGIIGVECDIAESIQPHLEGVSFFCI